MRRSGTDDEPASIPRIGSAEMVERLVDLPDLSLDPSGMTELIRRRTVAYVDVQLPVGVSIHRGMRELVKRRLGGRNPVCFVEDGYLRTGFAVPDHGSETMGQVGVFAASMKELFHAESAYVYPATLDGLPGETFL